MSPEVGNLALGRRHEAPKTRPVWVIRGCTGGAGAHVKFLCVSIRVSSVLSGCQAPNGCKGPPAHIGECLKRLQKFFSAPRGRNLEITCARNQGEDTLRVHAHGT